MEGDWVAAVWTPSGAPHQDAPAMPLPQRSHGCVPRATDVAESPIVWSALADRLEELRRRLPMHRAERIEVTQRVWRRGPRCTLMLPRPCSCLAWKCGNVWRGPHNPLSVASCSTCNPPARKIGCLSSQSPFQVRQSGKYRKLAPPERGARLVLTRRQSLLGQLRSIHGAMCDVASPPRLAATLPLLIAPGTIRSETCCIRGSSAAEGVQVNSHRMTQVVLLAALALPVRARALIEASADTTTLRARPGGTWRTPRTAAELLVVEGTAPGREFGELMDVLALSDGRVAVFDGRGVSGPELLLLNAEGERMRQLGRVGTGPGDYGPSVTPGSIAEGPDGEIWVWDRRSQRIVRWARDGGVLPAVALTVSIEPSNDAPLLAGPSQSIFAPAAGGDGSSQWQGYLRIALSGQLLDSLVTPIISGNPQLPSPFWPQWLMHPMRDGRASLARSDGAALLLSDRRTGRVVRIEVPVRGTPFLPRERAEWQALFEFEATKMSLPVPRLPAAKPIFARIQVDASGALLWLQRPVQGRPAPPEQRLSLGDGAPVLSYAEPLAFSLSLIHI